MSWKQWLETRRRLLTMFLAIAVLLAGTLLWLGWQLARLRSQMKTARELRAQGKNLREISREVGQPLDMVKGWLARDPKRIGKRAGPKK